MIQMRSAHKTIRHCFHQIDSLKIVVQNLESINKVSSKTVPDVSPLVNVAKAYVPKRRVVDAKTILEAYQKSPMKTPIPVLDIMASLLLRFKDDKGLKRGDTLSLLGNDLKASIAGIQIEDEEGKIDLSKLNEINLYNFGNRFLFDIRLVNPGEQLIPHGFGTKVGYATQITGYVTLDTVGAFSSASPRIILSVEDSSSIWLKETTLSPLKGIANMKISSAELLTICKDKVNHVIGLLYGYRNNGQFAVVRTNITTPSLLYAKGMVVKKKESFDKDISATLVSDFLAD
ncbi:MAG: hypothetical protein JNL74_07330 [Fibrobacteres bacterium]|nr:hypothetical protein [Fibrobacterota bacterium]